MSHDTSTTSHAVSFPSLTPATHRPAAEITVLPTAQGAAVPAVTDAAGSEEIPFRVPGRTVRLPAADIECICAQDNYVRIHAQGEEYVVRETIRGVESRLPRSFVRVHRSVIVNVNQVASCEPVRNGDAKIVLRSGRRLRVSRTRRAEFDERCGCGSANGRQAQPAAR